MSEETKRKVLTEIQERVLLVLSDEFLTVTQVIELTKANSSAVLKAINELKEMGLIEEEREKEFPRRRFVKLTDRGKIVAQHLKEIDKILNEQS
ncbi:winged helix-turn-helix domain-containing protein (plasmid) [Sulfolobus tengchongensis]|uniref:Winged helix-turn-helix domain-containing protein n=1 Tax=Sulfolobus tengchongensis TaxID=207809 RepID=A0AAX4L5B1_9CREN